MTAANGTGGLRERLLARPRPTIQVPIQVADSTRAQRAVVSAEEALRYCHLMLDEEQRKKAVTAAQRKVDKLVSELDACFELVTVRAMPPPDFEALADRHPPRPDKDLKDEDKGEAWNAETFPRALFLECVEGDLSPAEWETFLTENCSKAEREQLFLAAQVINVRAPSYAVPKD